MRLIATSLVVLVASLAACAAPPAVKAPSDDDGGPSISLKPAARPGVSAPPATASSPKASPAPAASTPPAGTASTTPFASPGGSPTPVTSAPPASAAPASAAPEVSDPAGSTRLAGPAGAISAVIAVGGLLTYEVDVTPALAVGETVDTAIRLAGSRDPEAPGLGRHFHVRLAVADAPVPAFKAPVQVPMDFLRPDADYELELLRGPGTNNARIQVVPFRLPAAAHAPTPLSDPAGVTFTWGADGLLTVTRALPAGPPHTITALWRGPAGEDFGGATNKATADQAAGVDKTMRVLQGTEARAPGWKAFVYLAADGVFAGKYEVTKPAP